MANVDTIEFEHIIKESKLKEYLLDRGNKHNYYRKYTPHVKDIILSNFIELSNGCNWDDSLDTEEIIKKGNMYATCFCCQQAENYAMWKVYGKSKNKEEYGMINFKRKQILELVKNPQKVVLVNCEGKTKEIFAGYNLYLADVFYTTTRKTKNSNIIISNSEKHNNNFRMKDLDDIKYLQKDYAYYNERECRLILEITDKKIKCNQYNKVRIYSKEIINEKLDYIYYNINNCENNYGNSDVLNNCKIICDKSKYTCYK